MTRRDRSELRRLLEDERLLALAVVVDGRPVVGLLPYATAEDFSALYVQASQLAQHTQGMTPGARWSGVIHGGLEPQADALAVPRLLVEGTVEPLSGSHPEFRAATRVFLSRYPSASRTLALADFGLYSLRLESARLVLGFARAVALEASDFRALAGA